METNFRIEYYMNSIPICTLYSVYNFYTLLRYKIWFEFGIALNSTSNTISMPPITGYCFEIFHFYQTNYWLFSSLYKQVIEWSPWLVRFEIGKNLLRKSKSKLRQVIFCSLSTFTVQRFIFWLMLFVMNRSIIASWAWLLKSLKMNDVSTIDQKVRRKLILFKLYPSEEQIMVQITQSFLFQ